MEHWSDSAAARSASAWLTRPFRVDCGLLGVQLALPELLFENVNLCFGRLGSGFRAFDSSPRLFFARANLLIVEHS